MKHEASVSLQRIVPLVRVCELAGMARSSVYASRSATLVAFPVRRGPKTLYSDARLTEEIRAVLAASPFVGEGYRKVWAKLRHRGRAHQQGTGAAADARGRVAGAEPRRRRARAESPRWHDHPRRARHAVGYGSDDDRDPRGRPGRRLHRDRSRDRGTVGVHAAKRATRYEALEPLRQGIRRCFGTIDANVACGLACVTITAVST